MEEVWHGSLYIALFCGFLFTAVLCEDFYKSSKGKESKVGSVFLQYPRYISLLFIFVIIRLSCALFSGDQDDAASMIIGIVTTGGTIWYFVTVIEGAIALAKQNYKEDN